MSAARPAGRGREAPPVRREAPGVALSVSRIRLAIEAVDPLAQAGLAQHVGRRPDIEVVPPHRLADADVVAVAAPMVTARMMEQIRRTADVTGARFILVLDRKSVV